MALRPHRIRGVIPALFLAQHAIGLRASCIIRETAPGRFYFDLDAHYAAIERRRRLVVPTAIIVSVLIAWIATRFFRG